MAEEIKSPAKPKGAPKRTSPAAAATAAPAPKAAPLPEVVAKVAVEPAMGAKPAVQKPSVSKPVIAQKPAVVAKPVAPEPVVVEPVVAKAVPAAPTVIAEPAVIKASLSAPINEAPALEPIPAASPAPEGIAEMSDTVATTTVTAAEKVKTMFTQLNDRAKSAMEKSAKVGEELTEFTKGNMEAFAVSAKTAAKGAETMGQEVAEYGKKSFETASAAMKSMAAVKSPTELFQLQSEFAKSSFDGAVSEASKLSEAWMKLAGDIFQPLSTRYTLATEKFKAAAL